MATNKKIKGFPVVFILICLSILIVGVIIIFNKVDSSKNDNAKDITENNMDNDIINETNTNNMLNEDTNVIEGGHTEDASVTNTNETTEPIVDNDIVTSSESQAINIAKQDFGNEKDYAFDYEGKDANGRHIVCVRNKKTTQAITWYYIDIETGTFIKE